jgi:hypothetical protein
MGYRMKLVIESAIIFFGTLMAAALVALGEPANAELALVQAATSPTAAGVPHRPKTGPPWALGGAGRGPFGGQ